MASADAPSRGMGRTVLRNAVFVTAGAWITKLLNVAFLIYVVRLLGDSGWGQYATVVAFIGLFSVFFDSGAAQHVERAIARDKASAQELFWNLVAVRLVLAVPGIASITGLALAIGFDSAIVTGILLLSSTFLLAALLTPLTSVLAANERFDMVTAVQVVGQVISMGLALVFLYLDAGFLALLYTGFISMPVQLAIAAWAIRRNQLGPLPIRIRPSSWFGLIRAGLPFGLTSVALTFSLNADVVILGLFFSASTVGWYSVAYRLVLNLVSISEGFLRSLTPSLSRAHMSDASHVNTWSYHGVRTIALLTLPIAVGGAILGERIITLLYGAEYSTAGIALSILVWTVPFHIFNWFSDSITTAIGQEHRAARIFVASAALNVALNFVLIPYYGMVGAAVVTVLTDGLAAVRLYFLLHRHVDFRDAPSRIARTAVAAAIMGFGVWLLMPLSLPLVFAASAIAYVLLIVATGALDIGVIRLACRQSARLPGLLRQSRLSGLE